jgi:hypothetical protein
MSSRKISDNKIEIMQVEIKMLQKLIAERDETIEDLNKSIELQNKYVERLEADYKDLFRELHFLSKEQKQKQVRAGAGARSQIEVGVGTSIDMSDPLFRVEGVSDVSAGAGACSKSPNSDIENSYHMIEKYE